MEISIPGCNLVPVLGTGMSSTRDEKSRVNGPYDCLKVTLHRKPVKSQRITTRVGNHVIHITRDSAFRLAKKCIGLFGKLVKFTFNESNN